VRSEIPGTPLRAPAVSSFRRFQIRQATERRGFIRGFVSRHEQTWPVVNSFLIDTEHVLNKYRVSFSVSRVARFASNSTRISLTASSCENSARARARNALPNPPVEAKSFDKKRSERSEKDRGKKGGYLHPYQLLCD